MRDNSSSYSSYSNSSRDPPIIKLYTQTHTRLGILKRTDNNNNNDNKIRYYEKEKKYICIIKINK